MNPFCKAASWEKCLDFLVKSFGCFACGKDNGAGVGVQADAQVQTLSEEGSLDRPSLLRQRPLRRSIRLLLRLAAPLAQARLPRPLRHPRRAQGRRTGRLRRIVTGQAGCGGFLYGRHDKGYAPPGRAAHPAFPVTIYYAFKQAENGKRGHCTTGWETFLDAVIQAGFAITGTWPIRTERQGRMREHSSNVLASSVVLVCRPRSAHAPTATRREFLTTLKAELPIALSHLQRGNIAPVDLAQTAIGPGMAVFTRYARVLDASGKAMSVREALALINETLDEVLAEQEGNFDADTRWAVAWFEHAGFAEGEFGVAETLSKAKNTSVAGMVEAGVVASRGGKVRLLKPAELPADWDPTKDKRLTVWEMVHQFIRTLDKGGEGAAAALVAALGSRAESARELAYRLYIICERKKRAQEALSYNALVQSWPEIARLARGVQPVQGRML